MKRDIMLSKSNLAYIATFMLGALCSAIITQLYIYPITFSRAPDASSMAIPGTAIKEIQLSQNTFGYLVPYDAAEIRQQPGAPLLDRLAQRTLEAEKNSFVMLSFDASKLCAQHALNFANSSNILILRPLDEQPTEIVRLPTANRSGIYNKSTAQHQGSPTSFRDL